MENKETHDSIRESFTCDTCGEGFPNKNQLKIHRRVHKGLKPYRCKNCGKEFLSLCNLKIHEISHTGLKPFKCDLCEKSFITNWDLSKHERIHTGEKPYNCDVCEKRFTDLSTFYRHVKSKHRLEKGKILSRLRLFKNEKRFETNVNNSVQTHIHTGTETPDFNKTIAICYQCRQAFPNEYQLRIHRRIHKGLKPYRCKECGKDFLSVRDLRKHESSHTGPYKCEQCDRRFRSKVLFLSHRNIHSRKKLYICIYCGKGFARVGNLNHHTRIHTGEKPYSCDLCERKFSDPSNFRRHKKLHKEKTLNDYGAVGHRCPQAEDKPFTCKDCGAVMKLGCTSLTNVFTVINLSDVKCFRKNHTLISQ